MNITKGIIPSAQKVLIYGPEGIGKSTLAAEFPNPLFIDTEGSTKHMDVARLDAPMNWTMLLEEVRYVYLNPTTCGTLVIDTADWAEALCISHVCAKAQKDGIEDFGYGKGYTYLAEEFGNLLNLLSEVIDKGVHVVMTAHSTIRKFEQPDEATAYDRWELKLQKKTAPLVKEWADMVLFANYKTFAVKSETKAAKAQGGKRTLFTVHRPAWDAKNRCDLPEELAIEDGKGKPVMPPELLAALPCVKPETKAAPQPVVSHELAPTTTSGAPAPAETVVVDREGETPVLAAELPTTELPKHLASLHQLMANDGVSEPEIRAAVASKGYFLEATPIEKYPADFVEGVLIAAWTQVLGIIKASKTAA